MDASNAWAAWFRRPCSLPASPAPLRPHPSATVSQTTERAWRTLKDTAAVCYRGRACVSARLNLKIAAIKSEWHGGGRSTAVARAWQGRSPCYCSWGVHLGLTNAPWCGVTTDESHPTVAAPEQQCLFWRDSGRSQSVHHVDRSCRNSRLQSATMVRPRYLLYSSHFMARWVRAPLSTTQPVLPLHLV